MIRESGYRFRVQTGASLIAHFVVAITAAHGANAMIVRAANDPQNMDSPRVSLRWRIQLERGCMRTVAIFPHAAN
jgi:hypothetical protein